MSTAHDKASIAIRAAANQWAARLVEPGLSHADKVAFAAWLRASPIHVREYLNAELLRFTVRTAVQDDTTDIRELLRDTSSNVIPWERRTEVPTTHPSRPARSYFRWAAAPIAAAALLVIGAALALVFSETFDSNAYSTAVGEIRRIALPDGSAAELNTHSKIRIDSAAGRRDILLTEGEAFFTVVKDPQRPFRVLSDPAQIIAVGTQFSVYRKPQQTVVTVVDGKVATRHEHKTLELTAGHQAVIEFHHAQKRAPVMTAASVDAVRATSWRQRRLIFDNQPLSEVIAEFNRYNRQQLIVADPELAAQNISGVFDPDKPQGLLLFLSRKGAVQATEMSDTALILTR